MTKTIAESAAVQVHIVMNSNTNNSGTLFGGCLMSWIDEVAGVVARRHSGCNICTASVDRLDFLHPACLGDVVSVEGRILYVGKSSMIVEVNSYVELLSKGEDEKKLVNRAYLTMVALDQDGHPTAVPRLIPANEDEEKLLRLGVEKKAAFSRKEGA